MRNLVGLSIFAATVTVAASALAAPPPSGGAQQPATGPAPIASDAVATLRKVCLPVLRGGDLSASARAAGFRLQDDVWTLVAPGDRRIELDPPDSVNPHDCGATITAKTADDPAVLAAVDAWAQSQAPPLAPVKSAAPVPGSVWRTSTWQADTPAGQEGVALSQQDPASSPPDTPSQSNLLVSLTPA